MDRTRVIFVAIIGVALVIALASTIMRSQQEQAALRATVVALESRLAAADHTTGHQDRAIASTVAALPLSSATTDAAPNSGPPMSTETSVPVPTATPTVTPVPSITPIPDTPPGTILEVGQAWRQGGLVLRLVNVDIHSQSLVLHLQLGNVGPEQRIVRYGQDNFSAADNRGRRLDTGGVDWYYEPLVQHDCGEATAFLSPGGSVDVQIPCAAGDWSGVVVGVDVGDPELSEVMFSCTNLSTITEARWRIPFYH